MILRTGMFLVAVAALSSLPNSSSAAFITRTTQLGPTGFNASITGLGQSGSTNFDSISSGTTGATISNGGISFSGNSRSVLLGNSTFTPYTLGVYAGNVTTPTTSPPNYLGRSGATDNDRLLAGAAAASGDGDFGDELTITVPAGTRAIGLNFIIDNDSLVNGSTGRLAVGATSVNTVANTETVDLLGTPNYKSFFVGIIGQLPADTFTSATLSLPTTSFLLVNGAYRIDSVAIYAIAVPEPTSLSLVGIGGILGLMRRRSRRS